MAYWASETRPGTPQIGAATRPGEAEGSESVHVSTPPQTKPPAPLRSTGASTNEQTAEPVDVEMEPDNFQNSQDVDMIFVGFAGYLEPTQHDEITEMLLMQLELGGPTPANDAKQRRDSPSLKFIALHALRRRSKRASVSTSSLASRSTSLS